MAQYLIEIELLQCISYASRMPHYTDEDRILIKNLRIEKQWGGATKIIDFFPNKPWSKSGVEAIIRTIDETGDCKRKPGSGRPRSARTADNISEVENRVLSQEDQPGTHQTPTEISRETGIPLSSVQRIIKYDLHLHVYKRVKVHQLNDRNKAQRVLCARQLLERYNTDVKVYRIWFSDEKSFSIHSPMNSQND